VLFVDYVKIATMAQEFARRRLFQLIPPFIGVGALTLSGCRLEQVPTNEPELIPHPRLGYVYTTDSRDSEENALTTVHRLVYDTDTEVFAIQSDLLKDVNVSSDGRYIVIESLSAWKTNAVSVTLVDTLSGETFQKDIEVSHDTEFNISTSGAITYYSEELSLNALIVDKGQLTHHRNIYSLNRGKDEAIPISIKTNPIDVLLVAYKATESQDQAESLIVGSLITKNEWSINTVSDFAWSPDGTRIAVISDTNVQVWGMDQKMLGQYGGIPSGSHSIVWSHDGMNLVIQEPSLESIWQTECEPEQPPTDTKSESCATDPHLIESKIRRIDLITSEQHIYSFPKSKPVSVVGIGDLMCLKVDSNNPSEAGVYYVDVMPKVDNQSKSMVRLYPASKIEPMLSADVSEIITFALE
jgi:WD40-like Beta Propeller Repeat